MGREQNVSTVAESASSPAQRVELADPVRKDRSALQCRCTSATRPLGFLTSEDRVAYTLVQGLS